MADYLYHPRSRWTNAAPWRWDWATRQPELYGGQVPVSITDTILPDRAPGPRRAANRAYQLAEFQVERYAAQTPAEFQTRLIPDRAPGRPRAGNRAYQIDTDQTDLYAPGIVADMVELFSGRQLTMPQRAPGKQRAASKVYQIEANQPFTFSNAPPPGKTLLPEQQFAQPRPQYPERRARRRMFPGTPAPVIILDTEELLAAARALMPDRARGPARATRTAYGVATNQVDLYAPGPAAQLEELFGARQMLPVRAFGARRSTADSYDLQPSLVDLYAPPPVPSANELFPKIDQLPGRVPFARRRFRRKFFPGAPKLDLTLRVEGQTLLPLTAPPRPRAANEAYQIDTYPVDIYAALLPSEIARTMLPERVFARARAARDAYVLAPSLVELYATQVPVEIMDCLMPQRAPGRPRAAASAYALQNNDVQFFAPVFVPPIGLPRRLLLGVGL